MDLYKIMETKGKNLIKIKNNYIVRPDTVYYISLAMSLHPFFLEAMCSLRTFLVAEIN